MAIICSLLLDKGRGEANSDLLHRKELVKGVMSGNSLACPLNYGKPFQCEVVKKKEVVDEIPLYVQNRITGITQMF